MPTDFVNAKGEGLPKQALNYAMTLTGFAYVWGGESPAEGGFDCSGLIYYAYQKFGITLPRTSQDLADLAKGAKNRIKVTRAQLEPGDLLVSNTTDNGKLVPNGHVMIYAGKDAKGNDLAYGARSSRLPFADQIGTTQVNWSSVTTMLRVVADPTKVPAGAEGGTGSDAGAVNAANPLDAVANAFGSVGKAFDNFGNLVKTLAFGIPFVLVGLALVGGGLFVAANGPKAVEKGVGAAGDAANSEGGTEDAPE